MTETKPVDGEPEFLAQSRHKIGLLLSTHRTGRAESLRNEITGQKPDSEYFSLW
jgi:hypothetical protein